jgi:hypothetical protein
VRVVSWRVSKENHVLAQQDQRDDDLEVLFDGVLACQRLQALRAGDMRHLVALRVQFLQIATTSEQRVVGGWWVVGGGGSVP